MIETAALLIAIIILAAVVRFAARENTPKEPPMYGNLSREKPARAMHIHNARVARDLMHPVRPVARVQDEASPDDDTEIDFTFREVDNAAHRAYLDWLAAQPVIPWRHLSDATIGEIRAMGGKVGERARVAMAKRITRRRRAAARGAK